MGDRAKLILGKDRNSEVTFGLPFPSDLSQAFQLRLAPSTQATVAIPGWAGLVKITTALGADVWVSVGTGTITFPTSPVPVAALAEMNPILRNVEGETNLNLISEYVDPLGNGAAISVIFYQKSGSPYVF